LKRKANWGEIDILKKERVDDTLDFWEASKSERMVKRDFK